MDRTVGSPQTQSVAGVRGLGVSVFRLPGQLMLKANIGLKSMHSVICKIVSCIALFCPSGW